MMKAKIFVVSQDLNITKLISETLQNEGLIVSSTNIPGTALAKCRQELFDLVFVDVHIREVSCKQLITDIKKVSPDTEIIVITTYAFPESIVKGEVLDIGGYLIQPLTPEKIKSVTNRALRQGELARENRRLLLTITAAKKEWEATVDAIEDPIFVTDFDYNILRANLATFRKLGKGVTEVLGQKCYLIFHCSDSSIGDCPGRRARDSGEPKTDIMLFNGLRQRLNCSVYPQIFPVGGGLVHYLREPSISTEEQSKIMAKYERIFDDAALPILFVAVEDYRIIDANQQAIKLFGYEPERMFNTELEDLFTAEVRETAIAQLVKKIEGEEG